MIKKSLKTLTPFLVAAMMLSCSTNSPTESFKEPSVEALQISKAHVIDLKQGTGNVSVNVNMKSETSSFTLKQITHGFESSVANVDSVEVRLFTGAPATWATPEDMWNDSGNQVASLTINSVSANNSIRFTGLLNGQDYSVSARAFGTDPNAGPNDTGILGTIADNSRVTPASDPTGLISVGDVITVGGGRTIEVGSFEDNSGGGGSAWDIRTAGPPPSWIAFTGGEPAANIILSPEGPVSTGATISWPGSGNTFTTSTDLTGMVSPGDTIKAAWGFPTMFYITVETINASGFTTDASLQGLIEFVNPGPASNVAATLLRNANSFTGGAGWNITSSNGAGGMGTGSDVGGGTAPARGGEYISVDSNGVLSIPNDDANNILDIDIQLMQDLTAEVDGSVNITPGDDADSGGPTEGISTPG